jgi:hypothetical protein
MSERFEIRVAGSGGQGVILAAVILVRLPHLIQRASILFRVRHTAPKPAAELPSQKSYMTALR